MFDLYNLLASGHTPDEVAAQFTQALNDAEARLKKEEEELRAREAEAKARKELEATKRADFMDATANLLAVIGKHYPDLAIEPNDEVCGPIADLIIMSIDLEGLRDRRHISLDIKPVRVKKADTDKDVFKRFFEQFNLN